MAISSARAADRPLRVQTAAVGMTLAVQILSALFYVADSWAENDSGGLALLELFVSIALVAGACFAAVMLRRLIVEGSARDDALAVARGSIDVLIQRRFAHWKLSKAEADVALFALKGCSVAEIARLRGAAEGTVRSQLSQIYLKASVKNQSALIAQFIEELLDPIVADG